jgi:hypothetical protein
MDQQTKLEMDDDADELYRCMWDGCKVHDKPSCSKSWLEKHVPTHGGKFNFACMISGCKQRFSSQVRTKKVVVERRIQVKQRRLLFSEYTQHRSLMPL